MHHVVCCMLIRWCLLDGSSNLVHYVGRLHDLSGVGPQPFASIDCKVFVNAMHGERGQSEFWCLVRFAFEVVDQKIEHLWLDLGGTPSNCTHEGSKGVEDLAIIATVFRCKVKELRNAILAFGLRVEHLRLYNLEDVRCTCTHGKLSLPVDSLQNLHGRF